ncbi:MAG: DNA repair protein RadA [Planctomycetes bacterium]|nr:DNA repair protein RadA [Planctomycetota bacterium]
MAKPRTHFLCRECGAVQSRWMGKCPDCGAWDALEKYVEPRADDGGERRAVAEAWAAADEAGAGDPITPSVATPLPEIDTAEVRRWPTGIPEVDRVLGGGFVPGSVVMLGGEPGIGKSTLLLQVAGRIAAGGQRVLYVSSEESQQQTRLRAERIFAADDETELPGNLANLLVLAETSLARVIEQTRKTRPSVMIVDSLQTVHQAQVEAAAGSVTQLRRCCCDLVTLARLSGIAIVVVGHVTKEGQLAGPKLVEHLVDAVLSFEGDRHHAHRVVRSTKNRFGTTMEVGLFEMTGRGLREVRDPGRGLDLTATPPPGSVFCPVMHGSRCLMVEIQALTAPGFPGNAKRRTSGLDGSRLAMLIAVLEQHGGLRLADQDIFASAVGGLRIMEPAADLAVCLAVAGAHLRRPLPAGVAVVGEVGLDGAVRHPPHIEQRRRESERRACGKLIMRPVIPGEGVVTDGVLGAETIGAALALLDSAPKPTSGAQIPTHGQKKFAGV